MSKRTDLLRQALDEDRAQREEIRNLKITLAIVKTEVAARIRAGDFSNYQRLQEVLVYETQE